MGANILSNRLHNRSREHHSHATRFAEAMQATAMHACKQPQIQRKAKRVDVRGERSNPKRGTRKGKGEFMQPWGQERSYHEQMRLKAEGRTGVM